MGLFDEFRPGSCIEDSDLEELVELAKKGFGSQPERDTSIISRAALLRFSGQQISMAILDPNRSKPAVVEGKKKNRKKNRKQGKEKRG